MLEVGLQLIETKSVNEEEENIVCLRQVGRKPLRTMTRSVE
jgi:hypothetical protein